MGPKHVRYRGCLPDLRPWPPDAMNEMPTATPNLEYTEALISDRPVVVRRRVLWGECDPAAVVYTPRFTEYVISARDWFLRSGIGFLDRPHPLKNGPAFPARAISLEFFSMLAADDLFDMTVLVAEMSNRTFTVEITAQHVAGARAAFAARMTSVCIDSGSGKAIQIPEHIRAAIEGYREATTHIAQPPDDRL